MRIAIVGGGMAGLSTAAKLVEHAQVTVVEAEFQCGYHSSGRSAAVFHIPFENDVISQLSALSEQAFIYPDDGYQEVSTPLPSVQFADFENKRYIEETLDNWTSRCPWIKPINRSELVARLPILDDRYETGTLDDRSLKLDVSSLLEGHRRRINHLDGSIRTGFRLREGSWLRDKWLLESESGERLEVDVVVNAAGAWANDVATRCDVDEKPLQPLRRTAVLVDPEIAVESWAMGYRAGGGLYFKPEGKLLMVSPADEIESAPCDAQPEIVDIAETLDRFNQTTTLRIDAPTQTWAGLRTFAPDRLPLIGYDALHPRFFWLTGFGGFGIQTSPGYSKLAAEQILAQQGSEKLAELAKQVQPNRFGEA